MKKILIILFVCSAQLACAQFAGVGVKAGLNTATFIGDDADGSDYRIGYNAGAYITFNLTEKFSVQPELLINSVGAKYSESGNEPVYGDYTLDVTVKLTYMSLPVVFLYKISDHVNLQAGPQVSLLVNSRTKYVLTSDDVNGNNSEYTKNKFEDADFGIIFGLGTNVGPVNASLRYYLGVIDVPHFEDAAIRNGAFMLSVGYNFSKK